MLNYDWVKAHKREVLFLLAGVLLLFLLQLWSVSKERAVYIEDEHKLIAIKREDLAVSQSIPLVLEVEADGKRQSFDVMLSFVEETGKASASAENVENDENSLNEEIQQLVSTLEAEENLQIILPEEMEDGTQIRWKMPSLWENLLLLLLFPLGLYFLYRTEKEKVQKEKHRWQEDIRRALPTFNDQVLLLMHSGLIFHDAFFRIVENYEGRPEKDGFNQVLSGIAETVRTTGQSIVSVMEVSKQNVGMREYSRMVNILADNQVKGVDLQGKLESESTLLWEGRKALALQKGKEMETKLTFPLAVLLLVVVIIAGVPAMMNM